jgi:hypothetical protein
LLLFDLGIVLLLLSASCEVLISKQLMLLFQSLILFIHLVDRLSVTAQGARLSLFE